MKKLAVLISALCANSAMAAINHPSGTNMGYGFNSNPQSILSAINNPASPAAAIGDSGEWQIRFGLLSSVGVGAEFGEVDNFADDIDALDALLNSPDPDGSGTLDAADATYIEGQFNDFLNRAEQYGYAKVTAGAHAPIVGPFIFGTSSVGTFTFDANVYATGKLNFLSDGITYNDQGTPVNPNDDTLDTNSAMYVKAATVTEISFGYSRRLMEFNSADIYLGARAKSLDISLVRAVQSLTDNGTAANTFLEDALDQDSVESSGMTFDLGVLYAADHYRLGVTVQNLVATEFDYNAMGGDAATEDALIATGKLDAKSKYTLDSQTTAEAAVYSQNRKWVFNVAYDMNAISDPVGDEYQWATASVGYTGGLLLPGVRLGYRQNLAGSELSYVSAGLTLFRFVNIDAMMSTDTINVDGSEQPRALAANIGLELNF